MTFVKEAIGNVSNTVGRVKNFADDEMDVDDEGWTAGPNRLLDVESFEVRGVQEVGETEANGEGSDQSSLTDLSDLAPPASEKEAFKALHIGSGSGLRPESV